MSENTTTLWRPAGPAEWDLVLAADRRRWPPRLADQPIFYPVLNEDYAIRIARDWNVPASGIGIVARFEIETSYLDRHEVHQVGGQSILEYWIPADGLEEFNDRIVGRIIEVRRFVQRDGETVQVLPSD